LSLIDQHAHPFSLRGGPLDLAAVSLDVRYDADADRRRHRDGSARLFQELMTVRLSERLGCDAEDLPAARAEAALDWRAYCAGLFADAGITDLVMDAGISAEGGSQLDDLGRLSGCGIHPIFRLEPMVDRLIEAGASAREIVTAVEEAMAKAAADGNVGFKTIAAYRTGLRVDPDATVAEAEASLEREANVPVRRRGKACRDLVLRRALGVAAELQLPVQVHTGFGDSDIRLAEADPLLLEELLRTPEGSTATLVLIHGSYPWHEEQAWLATTRPNVWAEVSLFDIFSPVTMGSRLLRWIDLAPTDKLIAGTDGHGEPEVFWFAAGVLREGWATVRATLTEAGVREAWLARAERRIFEENARELYGV